MLKDLQVHRHFDSSYLDVGSIVDHVSIDVPMLMLAEDFHWQKMDQYQMWSEDSSSEEKKYKKKTRLEQ